MRSQLATPFELHSTQIGPGSRPVRWSTVLRLGALVLIAFFLGGLLQAQVYTRMALPNLGAVAPAAAMFKHYDADAWWAADTAHLQQLTDNWPASVPSIIGEITLLWAEQQQVVHAGTLKAERGYSIVPPGAAGQAHLLAGAIQGRLRALTNGWSPIAAESDRMHYAGYPLADVQGTPVSATETQAILDSVPVPDAVMAGYRVVLLPYVLKDTAGLGTAGQAIIGAAPQAVGQINPNRTAYTLLHELGHHVHFTFLDGKRPELWTEYMELRKIAEWAPSGAVGTETWSLSPQETFAEDFRLLFGPPGARAIPHGTSYGDPELSPQGGDSVRGFMLRAIGAAS